MEEPTPHRKRSWRRRFALLALVLIGLLLLSVALVQTPPAKRLLAQQATSLGTQFAPWPVSVRGISGVLPFNLSVGHVALGASEAPWFEAEDLQLRLGVTALLSGQVRIARVGAARLALHALPPAAPAPPAPEPTSYAMPAIPPLPSWLSVDVIQIKRVEVDAPVLGKAAHLSVDGAVHPGEKQPVRVALRGLDDTQLALELGGGWTADDVGITLTFHDASLVPALAGLAGPLDLQFDLAGPWNGATLDLRSSLAGQSLASLKGTLGLRAPITLAAEGTLVPPAGLLPETAQIHLGDSIAISIDTDLAADGALTLRPTAIVAAHVQAGVEGRFDLDGLASDLHIRVAHDDLGIAAPGQSVSGPLPVGLRVDLSGTPATLNLIAQGSLRGEDWIQGEAHVQQGTPLAAQGTFTMRPAKDVLPPALDELLRDGAALDFDVTYADNGISLKDTRLRLAGAALDMSGTTNLAAAQINLQAALQVDSLSAFQGVAGVPMGGSVSMNAKAAGDANQTTLNLDLQVAHLEVPQVKAPAGDLHAEVIAGGFPDALTKQLKVKLDGSFPGLLLADTGQRDVQVDGDFRVEDLKRIAIAALRVRDGNLALTAQGGLDLEARSGDLSAALDIADLKPYAALAGANYGGRLNLRAEAGSTDTPGLLRATLDGTLADLSGLPAEWADLAGPAIEAHAEGNFDGATAALTAMDLRLALGEVAGTGQYVLDTQALEASVTAKVPELDLLSPALQTPMAGDLALTAKASGTLDVLAVEGDIQSASLLAGPWQSEDTKLSFQAKGIPADVQASVALTAARDAASLAVDADLTYAGSAIQLTAFKAVSGENRIDAAGTVDTVTLRGGGTVDAALPDLAALRAWVDLPLEGNVALSATLTEATGALEGSFSAHGVRVPDLTLDEATATFALQRIFDQPAGKLDLSAAGLSAPDVVVSQLALHADGPYEQIQSSLEVAGQYGAVTPFTLKTTSTLGTTPLLLDLATLDGKVGEIDLRLDAPATIRYDAGVLTVTPLRIGVAGGNLHAGGEYSPEKLALEGGWEGIPLSLAALAGAPELDGSTTGNLTLNGTLAAPDIAATLALVDVRISDPESTATPLNLSLDATLNRDGLRAQLKADAGVGVRAEAQLSAPVHPQLQPFDPGYDDGTPLDGQFRADIDLAALPALLLIDDQQMSGQLKADMALRGTLGNPGTTGFMEIAQGYYENAASGTILDQLAVRLDADEDAIRLTRFSASDTVGGSITAEGDVQLNAEQQFPFKLDIALHDPRLVHRDEISAKADGTLSLSGDATGAKVAGVLRAGPAYIAIPERLPAQQVTTVEFTEVGGEDEVPEEDTEEVPPYRIALDITCDIPGQVFVRGPTLDSEWEGNLKIAGFADDPLIKGVLNIRKGYLDFLGSTFQLDESTIAFDGTSPPSPYLNVLAKSEKKDLTALLRLEGDVSSLSIKLDSDPPVPRDEILSQVLFGQSVSEISAVQAIQLARYAPLFSSKLSAVSVLGSGSAKPFMLDRLNLRSGSGAGDASVSAGKYLGNDLYVEFEQGLGSQKSEASIEWRFAPHWALKGKTGSNAEGGAGLFWKKNY